jgi:hypothetical protein
MLSQDDDHLPSVVVTRRSNNKVAALQAVYQPDCALVLEEQPFGQGSDRAGSVRGHCLDGQQRLMLPGLDPLFRGRTFTEIEKPENLVPELS